MKIRQIKQFNYILSAFTLAEVLITLSVIGIVAAMTVPNLLKKNNDTQYKAAAKKAYSVAQNAYNLSISENGSGFGPVTTGTVSYDKFNAIKSKLHVIKDCTYGTGSFGKCWATNGVGDPNATPVTCQGFIVSFQNANASFITSDGIAWMLYTYSTTTGADYIAIDTNGTKPPNEWGKDAFILTMDDIKLKPTSSGCTYPNKDGTIITDFSFLLE